MSRDLQIKKGGRVFAREWDDEINDFVDVEIEEDELPSRLYDSICIEKGFTLKDFFLMIRDNMDVFFLASGCPFLDEIVEQAFEEPKANESRKGMAALCIGWMAFIEKENNEEFVTEYIKFYGIGNEDYALEFAPINELMMYPITINEKYEVVDGLEDGEVRFSCNRKFFLIDLVVGIINELSYMGPPEMKAFALEELKKSADSTIEIISQEEMDKRFKEKTNKNKKPCAICGEDSRSPDFGTPKGICPKCYSDIKEN